MITKDKIRSILVEVWDREASHYDLSYGHGLLSNEERESWLQLLEEMVGVGTPLTIIDVGTGTGLLALFLAELGHKVIGFDISEGMMAYGTRKAKAEGLTVDFRYGSAEELPLESASADVVVNRHLLWTLPEPLKALREWRRVLNPGGRLIVFDGLWPPHNWSTRVGQSIAKMLIMLRERRNPWKGHGYPRDLDGHLPLRHLMDMNMMRDVLSEAGFRQVEGRYLAQLARVQRANLPFRYRLLGDPRPFVAIGHVS